MTDSDRSDPDQLETRLRDWGQWARRTDTTPGAGSSGPGPQLVAGAGSGSVTRPGWLSAGAVAAAVVVALVAGVLWVRAAGPGRAPVTATSGAALPAATPSSAPLRCPARHLAPMDSDPVRRWVPSPPVAVSTGGRLLPRLSPSSVVICSYRNDTPVALRQRVLGGDLNSVTEDLSRLGGGKPDDTSACSFYLDGTDAQNYLIGVRFGSGLVWVAAPGNHCVGSSNGVDFSPVNLRADAEQAMRNGVWDTDPSVTRQCARAATRDGNGHPLIPPKPTQAIICVRQNFANRAFSYLAADDSITGENSLETILSSYPGQFAAAGCTVDLAGGGLLVVLAYHAAPDVVLAATPHCRNGIPAPGAQPLIDTIIEFQVDRQ